MKTNKTTVVSRAFRTNPLSLIEGGATVEVIYENRSKIYTNIKNPKAYVGMIRSKTEDVIKDVLVDGITYETWLKG